MGGQRLMGDRRLVRSRWAAIGAAVAVSLAGGGAFFVSAASGTPSATVTIDPVRILDTRNDVGLAGPFRSPIAEKLQVVGSAVPAGATGVLMNVTVVSPQAAGYLSVRPGDASGPPSTSSLNFPANETVANAVQVALPTAGPHAGQIDITYDALGVRGPTTEVLVDVVGYLLPGAPGPAGPQGPAGPVNLRWAKVGLSVAGAPLIGGSGAVSSLRTAPGTVDVTFSSSVVGCAWTATINENDSGDAVSGEVTVERSASDNVLTVKTWPSNGVGDPVDLAPIPSESDGFSLMVVCP